MSDVSVKLTMQEDVSRKLQQATSAARSATSQLQAMGRQIDSAFRTNSPEQFASRLGNAIDSAEDDMDSLGDAVEAALDSLDQGISGNLAGDLDSAAESANDLAEAAENAGQSMDDLADTTDQLGDSVNDIGGSDSGLGGLSDEADRAGQSMSEADTKASSLAGTLKKLFAVVSASAILASVGNFAKDSVEIGQSYTSMMSEVQAISGATGSEINMLEQTAREYGATTVFSATEAAEALKYMSLAGWSAQQSSTALGGVLDLAAASGMGLGQASDMVTDYLSAFGMQANESAYFADMLAYAQSKSNTTAAQLGEAYRNSAANMHAAGQDVETTTSLLEAMANQGYKGSEAGTALAATMRDITQKMKDGAIKIDDTSVAVQDSQGNFRDLTDILIDVENATDGMGDAQKATALGSTFTADSIKALNMILTEGMDNISGYEEELRRAGGTASDMADVMNDNLAGDKAALGSAWEELQLQVFENMEEPLRSGTQYLTNQIVPILTDWVPDAFGAVADGAAKIGNALKPLIETVLKNPSAVSKAFTSIGSGFLAMKGVNTALSISKDITDAGGMVGALSKLSKAIFGSPWAAGAAVITTAVAGIAAAVHYWNDMQVDASLAEHFGNLELSEPEIEDIAGKIINVDWLANINLALGEFENAEGFHDEAQAAWDANRKILFSAGLRDTETLNITLDPKLQEDYISNIETYLTNKQNELQSLTFASVTSMETILGDKAGSAFMQQVSTWAAEDTKKMSGLSSSLTALIQDALKDGVLNVEEQAAINILQQKINSIVSGWKEAQADAAWQTIEMKWSGKELTEDSFVQLIEESRSQRRSAIEALDADTTEMNAVFNGWLNSDKIDQSQRDQLGDLWSLNYKNIEGEAIGRELAFATNTLQDTYGDLVSENLKRIQDLGGGDTMQVLNDAARSGDWSSVFQNSELSYARDFMSTNGGGNRKALLRMYESMKPDVDDMRALIDSYAADGQQIPKALMDSYNQAIEVGAAAGDTDAAWQHYANSIMESGNKQLIDAISNPDNPMYESLRTQMTPELERAIDRALYAEQNAAESADLSELFNSILGLEDPHAEIDLGRLSELCEQYGLDISGYLAEKGIEVDGGNTKIDLKDFDLDSLSETLKFTGEISDENLVFEVVKGDTLSGISEKAGVALNELIAANPQIENPDVIEIGQKINIPADKVDVDASGVGEAVEQAGNEAQDAANATEPAPIETTQQVKTIYEKGEEDRSALEELNSVDNAEPVEQQVPTTITFEVASLDDSALANAISEQLKQGEAVPVTVPADIIVKQGGFDASASLASTQTDLTAAYATAFPVDGTADIMIAKAGDNISALYSQIGSELQSAFNHTYSVSANALITVNYSLANPTANISFSGGGTGSASVSAAIQHAEGGYFDTPHFGLFAEAGGEWFIPNDGSDRSRNMVLEAGKMLGMDMQGAGNLQPVNLRQESGQPVSGNGNTERTINVNVNGSGSIQVSGSGASKESIVNVMLENLRDVFMNIVSQEIIEEGDCVHEF